MDDFDLAEYEQELHYSRVLSDVRAASPELSDNLQKLANKRALDPSIFDQFPAFFMGGEISSNRWDDYDTSMGKTSLTNYSEDAARGVPYLISHNTRAENIGYTLTGTYEGNNVRAEVYMIQEPTAIGHIARIKAGIITDQSIGFRGGQWMCTICNRDMQNWWTSDGCQHILGLMYPQVDSKGNVKKGAKEVKARAVIENAHLGEVSDVYAGATPGAMIDKCRSLATAGDLSQRQLDLVEVRYKMPLPSQRHVFAVGKREDKRAMTDEEIQALQEELATSKGKVTRLEGQLTVVRSSLTVAALPAERTELPANEQIEWLAAERKRLIPLADAGVAYRKELIKTALEQGGRARGDKFQREKYEADLNTMSLEGIRQLGEDWKEMADTLFPAGRQSADTGTGAPPKDKDGKPVTAQDRRELAAYGG